MYLSAQQAFCIDIGQDLLLFPTITHGHILSSFFLLYTLCIIPPNSFILFSLKDPPTLITISSIPNRNQSPSQPHGTIFHSTYIKAVIISSKIFLISIFSIFFCLFLVVSSLLCSNIFIPNNYFSLPYLTLSLALTDLLCTICSFCFEVFLPFLLLI